jgi:NAD(P)-dependent dehydrogenase (short-subunit alcohol dehydrogenase family)
MVGRDAAKTRAVVDEVKRRSGSTAVESLLCDFSSQAQVRDLARDVLARCEHLDVLVNNAGTVYPTRTLTADGIESTFAVNHLGSFLLTNLLLDLLRKSAPARIVVVSSKAHYRASMDLADLGYARDYGVMRAYGRSKLANVLFTRELARRLAGTGVTANCLHPGVVATGIWTHGPPPSRAWLKPIIAFVARVTMITPAQGADAIVYLATSPEVEGKTGLYYDENRAREPSALAQDDDLARRLWEESAKLVKL